MKPTQKPKVKKPRKTGDPNWQQTIPITDEFRSRSAGFERARARRTR